ncbi:hypothetical protein PHISCL_07594 [Aspergillus sclerotialis]|uniref:Uncharacterized protein n=1 Tax=Aspergillus sclerotialis TaxID=2070753 RepID=A0A3A2ZQ90_9EURO|nr:hypothetical protein PHISCL_07594 [Aspergillus sclerotialis]
MRNLRKILIRLQNQAWVLTRADIDKPLLNATLAEDARYDEIPHIFSSIAEAYDFFESLIFRFYHELNEIANMNMGHTTSGAVNYLLTCYESLAKRWTEALDRFEQSRGQLLTHKEHIGLKILRIHQKYSQFVRLDHGRIGRTDPSSWDKYDSIFEDIVSQASSVLDMTGDSIHISSMSSTPSDKIIEGQLKPSFSVSMGIVAPLYDIATLCRDPSIRRRAMNVLRSASRQEGLLNSHVSAVAAEMVIGLEENLALGGGLNDLKDFTSVAALALESEQQLQQRHQQGHRSIRRSFEVPDAARLSLAYPSFDTVNRKAFLNIGDMKGTQVKIPLPAMTAMLDMER